MAANPHHADSPTVSLNSILKAGDFRTVHPNMSNFSGGVNEVPVEMALEKDFVSSFENNPTLDERTVYGYAKITSLVSKMFDGREADSSSNCEIVFTDWKDKVLVKFLSPGSYEKTVFVTRDEVRSLLENCLRAPL